MIKYYKSLGNIPTIYKIEDGKIYFYDSRTKHWILSIRLTARYVSKWYKHNQLTLLDMVMLGIPE